MKIHTKVASRVCDKIIDGKPKKVFYFVYKPLASLSKLTNGMSISVRSGSLRIVRAPLTHSNSERSNEKEILVLTNVAASDGAMPRLSATISDKRW